MFHRVHLVKFIGATIGGLSLAGCSMHFDAFGGSESSDSKARPSYVAAPKTATPKPSKKIVRRTVPPKRERFDYVAREPLAPIAPRPAYRGYDDYGVRSGAAGPRARMPETYNPPPRTTTAALPPRYDERNPGRSIIVRQGETLFSIAQHFNTSIDDLMDFNDLDSTSLSVGQRLYLPPVRNARAW